MKQSNKYHKILSLFKRNMEGDKKFIIGEWSTPELGYLKDNDWQFSEKVDGTNIRVKWDGNEVSFGGRSDEAQLYTPLLTKLQIMFMGADSIKKFIDNFGAEEMDVVLYGEGYGCFSSNTGILLDDGSTKTISEIVNNKLDIKVLTYDFKENVLTSSKILNYFKYPTKKLIRIELEKTRKGGRGRYNQIICTENHLVYTDKGYIKAKEIKPGERIMCLQRDLSFIQEQALYGILLGDGSIKDFTITITHSSKQKGYIDSLKKLFGNIHICESKYISGYGSDGAQLVMSNKEMFKRFADDCVVNGKKEITAKWIKKLTPLALAFWYMDDGSIDNKHRKNQRVNLATEGYNLGELKIIQNILFEKFQIRGTLKKSTHKEQYSLRFSTEESKIFFILIAPYIIKSMKYKLPKYIQKIPCIFDDIDSRLLYESKTLKPTIVKQITGVLNKRIEKDYVYDIETKNKNYFVGSGFLVHNSKIQKGGGNYIKDGVDFVLFDVAINGLYLERENVEDIANKFGVKVIPIIGHGTLEDAIELTKKGFKSQWGDFIAEGIVARPRVELRTRRGDRIITKVKYKDFN